MTPRGWLLALGLTACVVGDPDAINPNLVDAGTTTDAPAGAGDGAQANCEQPVTTLPDGHHNAGQACLDCHDGNGAPLFHLAGTLYDSAGGTAPVAGATIVVVDGNGITHKLPTASNGNFYTSQTIPLPAMVSASKCPDTQAMPSSVQDGNCNSCHQAATTGRVHLP